MASSVWQTVLQALDIFPRSSPARETTEEIEVNRRDRENTQEHERWEDKDVHVANEELAGSFFDSVIQTAVPWLDQAEATMNKNQKSTRRKKSKQMDEKPEEHEFVKPCLMECLWIVEKCLWIVEKCPVVLTFRADGTTNDPIEFSYFCDNSIAQSRPFHKLSRILPAFSCRWKAKIFDKKQTVRVFFTSFLLLLWGGFLYSISLFHLALLFCERIAFWNRFFIEFWVTLFCVLLMSSLFCLGLLVLPDLLRWNYSPLSYSLMGFCFCSQCDC